MAEIRNQNENPCEGPKSLVWVATGAVISPSLEVSLPDLSGHNPERASSSTVIIDPALSQWLDERPPQSSSSRSGSVVWLLA